MVGIIGQSINRDDPYANVQGYNAAQATRKKTVAERVNEFINGGSPMNQLSDTRVKQAGEKRGLLNSSMMQGEAERARIETATPIAMADDQAEQAYDLTNRDANNTSYQFTASEGNRARSQVEQGNQDIKNIGKQGEEARLTDTNQGLIQSRLIGETGAQDRLNITQTGKETRLNIADTGAQDRLNITAQGAEEKKLIAERGQIEKDLQTADLASRKTLLDRQGEIDTALQTLRGTQESTLQKERSVLAKDEMYAGYTYDQLLQTLKGDQAKELTRIETESNELMEGRRSAAQTFSSFAMSIGEILANADIPESAKQGLVDIQLKLLQNAMSIADSFSSDTNLASMLDFSGLGTLENFQTPAQIAAANANTSGGGNSNSGGSTGGGNFGNGLGGENTEGGGGNNSTSSQYANYVNSYPDILADYNQQKASGQINMTIEQFGQQHWQNNGQGEGRSLTGPTTQSTNTATGTTGTGTGGTTNTGTTTSAPDYSDPNSAQSKAFAQQTLDNAFASGKSAAATYGELLKTFPGYSQTNFADGLAAFGYKLDTATDRIVKAGIISGSMPPAPAPAPASAPAPAPASAPAPAPASAPAPAPASVFSGIAPDNDYTATETAQVANMIISGQASIAEAASYFGAPAEYVAQNTANAFLNTLGGLDAATMKARVKAFAAMPGMTWAYIDNAAGYPVGSSEAWANS